MVYEKFDQGGWKTILVTLFVITTCAFCRRHYNDVGRRKQELETMASGTMLAKEASCMASNGNGKHQEELTINREHVTLVVLFQHCDSTCWHLVQSALHFPGFDFKNVIGVSAAVVGTNDLKSHESVEERKLQTEGELEKFATAMTGLGFPTETATMVTTDTVRALADICLQIRDEYPNIVVFLGDIFLARERTLVEKIFHNETGDAVDRLLRANGIRTIRVPLLLTKDGLNGTATA